MSRYRGALAAAGLLAAIQPQAALAQSSVTYTYDALGRLTGTTYGSGVTTTYQLDAADNRTRLTTALPNHAPIALNDAAAANAGGPPVTIAVLSNDSDPDGDPLTITSTTAPSKGSVTISGGNLIYSATFHQSGVDTFSYTISDGRGGSATATVSVTVNTPVWANPDALYIHPIVLDLTAQGYGKPYFWWACVNATANDVGQNLSINSVYPSDYAYFDSSNVCYKYANLSNVVTSPVVVYYGLVGTGGSDIGGVAIYLLPN